MKMLIFGLLSKFNTGSLPLHGNPAGKHYGSAVALLLRDHLTVS